MDIKLKNSDLIILPSGEYDFVDNIDEAVQQTELIIKIKKGSFVYNKDLGVDFGEIKPEDTNPEKTAQMIINEALTVFDSGVRVKVNSFKRNNDNRISLTYTVYLGEKTKETVVILHDENI